MFDRAARLRPAAPAASAALAASVALSAVLWCTAAPAAAEGRIANGRKIAETHCARCHVIGDFNKYGGIGSTQSFQLLVKHRPDYRARFETFFERPPHPAFVTIDGFQRRMPELPVNAAPVSLPLAAINDILAFVETLKPAR